MNTSAPDNSLLATKDQLPHDFYDQLLTRGPLHWDEAMKGWLAVSYDCCKTVLSNEDLFRHPYADADDTMVEVKGGARNITVLQGEEHDRMHRYVLQIFSPKNIRLYTEHHVIPTTDFLIDRFANLGRAELFDAFCKQLPCRTFMSLFGMDARDDQFLHHVIDLHDTIMEWAGGRHFHGEELTRRALAASHELNDILLPYIRQSRERPGNNLLGRLWAEAPERFSGVTEEDMVAICRELYLGGSDTTVHALANAIYLLLTNESARLALQADERGGAIDNFIEEVMRTHGSVEYRYRIANRDIELAGVQVKKDQVVFTLNAAANRDPGHYSCPAKIDLARSRPRDHLAFNTGPRTCVGAGLARAEMRIALDSLMQRLRGLRLDPGAEQPAFSGIFTRSFRPLHVLFD
jgi:cytochrome P450